ncbi:MAG TPA: hypothetical protein VFE86_00810 [Ilumatobacteraceae bacterium]|jgi:hypothetical protein|nr:hypothetical protein [Ilumatobacteraceae bacterium]
MIPRAVNKRIRLMWIAALASAAWVNRKDVVRWANFGKRAVRQRTARPLSDLVTEAKVRAAVTSDPVLRRDPALTDLAVHNGVVTLLTSSTNWPDEEDHLRRLLKIKGISDVKALNFADS